MAPAIELYNNDFQEKRLRESGRVFSGWGAVICHFRTAKAPWSVLEIPVLIAGAVPATVIELEPFQHRARHLEHEGHWKWWRCCDIAYTV